jgi:hypothetical protein
MMLDPFLGESLDPTVRLLLTELTGDRPGDPVQRGAGRSPAPEEVMKVSDEIHKDQPFCECSPLKGLVLLSNPPRHKECGRFIRKSPGEVPPIARCRCFYWSSGRNWECGKVQPCPDHSSPSCAACKRESTPDRRGGKCDPLRTHTCGWRAVTGDHWERTCFG